MWPWSKIKSLKAQVRTLEAQVRTLEGDNRELGESLACANMDRGPSFHTVAKEFGSKELDKLVKRIPQRVEDDLAAVMKEEVIRQVFSNRWPQGRRKPLSPSALVAVDMAAKVYRIEIRVPELHSVFEVFDG